MAVVLPPLPFDSHALEPHMSARTLEFHHDRHHQAYVKKTNELIAGTDLEFLSLEDIVRQADARGDQALFNQAGQAWNHEFLWKSLSPDRSEPGAKLSARLDASFGGRDGFAKAFKEESVGHFASGWAWLCASGEGLEIISTHDADTALVRDGLAPLLVLDLWEHAYYLDHQNRRADFVEAFLDRMINWDFATRNLEAQAVGEFETA